MDALLAALRALPSWGVLPPAVSGASCADGRARAPGVTEARVEAQRSSRAGSGSPTSSASRWAASRQ
eukprot:5551792-Alexandrium_andersonii.AAC.1